VGAQMPSSKMTLIDALKAESFVQCADHAKQQTIFNLLNGGSSLRSRVVLFVGF
jgi:hypothetical protein